MHNLWNNVNKLWKHMKTYRDKQNRTNIKKNTNICCMNVPYLFFPPPARWRSLDFIRGASRPPPSPSPRPPVPQPRAADSSGCCRTSAAPAGTARPQPRAPDLSGHCRTSARCQRECQNICQTACQNRYQIPYRISDRMSKYMPERIPNRMSE